MLLAPFEGSPKKAQAECAECGVSQASIVRIVKQRK
jgi:hypothetical protein